MFIPINLRVAEIEEASLKGMCCMGDRSWCYISPWVVGWGGGGGGAITQGVWSGRCSWGAVAAHKSGMLGWVGGWVGG